MEAHAGRPYPTCAWIVLISARPEISAPQCGESVTRRRRTILLARSTPRHLRRLSRLHDDRRPDFCSVVEVDHVVVHHADAARRCSATNSPGLVGPVDAIKC